MGVEEFDERYAAWLISGEGFPRQLAASLAAEIRNLVPRHAQTKTERLIPRAAYSTAEDLLPPAYRTGGTKRRGRIMMDDPEAINQFMRRTF